MLACRRVSSTETIKPYTVTVTSHQRTSAHHATQVAFVLTLLHGVEMRTRITHKHISARSHRSCRRCCQPTKYDRTQMSPPSHQRIQSAQQHLFSNLHHTYRTQESKAQASQTTTSSQKAQDIHLTTFRLQFVPLPGRPAHPLPAGSGSIEGTLPFHKVGR